MAKFQSFFPIALCNTQVLIPNLHPYVNVRDEDEQINKIENLHLPVFSSLVEIRKIRTVSAYLCLANYNRVYTDLHELTNNSNVK